MSDHTLDHGVIFQVRIPEGDGLTYRTLISNLEDGGVLVRLRSGVVIVDERGVPVWQSQGVVERGKT